MTATAQKPSAGTMPPASGSSAGGTGSVWSRYRWLTAPAVALLIFIALWEFLSWFSDGWLPGLVEIAERSGRVWTSETLWSDVLTTLRRVFTVFIATVVAGTVIGVAAGFSRRLRAFLRPILTIALAIPDLVYIIMVILILGLAESSGLISLVIAIAPLVINVVMNATLDRNKSLDEMAKTYRFSAMTYATQVLWYQLRPAIHAGTRTAFAFSWKLMVLLESLTRPDGIGAAIMTEFRYMRPAEMITYAVLFTVLMKLIEVLIADRLFDDRQSHQARKARLTRSALA